MKKVGLLCAIDVLSNKGVSVVDIVIAASTTLIAQISMNKCNQLFLNVEVGVPIVERTR